MFAVVIAFVCFYYAERILFAIAKFFVHLFGEGEGRAEMGEGRGGEGSRDGRRMGGKCECTKK